MSETVPEPNTFVIFGGTGDLSRRKLLPALGRLSEAGQLGGRCTVIGVGRSADVTDEAFRKLTGEALAEAGVSKDHIRQVVSGVYYQPLSGSPDHYRALGARLEALEREHDVPGNRTFYLALPPTVFPGTVTGLGETGLNRSTGWTRLVVEKPFGRDLQSARELNTLVHRYFDESQIYRIDHYLGKETVQNLLVFRFGNAIFEPLWNRERVHSVEITVAESLGLGTRAGYYDQSGALRDMVQNHLSQLVSLIAMEVPIAFEADAIRFEKIKVLRSIAPIKPSDVVFGQYGGGRIDGRSVAGYSEEPGVPAGSQTETFVAMRLAIDSWRWQGVPFYLRTGKRLPRRLTQIAVRFRHAPVRLFEPMGCQELFDNVLLIRLQPDEGFSLQFDVKTPGSPLNLQRIPLSFKYKDRFPELPEAYQTLLLDVLEGDQTLFVHANEVEESWRLYAPLQEQPPEVRPYAAGSWGPDAVERLGMREPERWQIE